MKVIFLLVMVSLVPFCSGLAVESAVTVDTVLGLHGQDTLATGVDVVFYIRLYSDDTANMKGITNGFSIYSTSRFPAVWDTTVGDNELGPLGSDEFDLVWVMDPFTSRDGSGADTVGFGGARMFGAGMPESFDDTVYTITIGPIEATEHCKMICLDSSYYPPTGEWKWSGGPDATLSRYPTWPGPYCYTIWDENGGPCLAVDDSVLVFNMVETVDDPADQTVSVSDCDGTGVDITLSTDSAWLNVSPTSGNTLPAEEITVSVDGSGVTAGTYIDTIRAAVTSFMSRPLVLCSLYVDTLMDPNPRVLVFEADGTRPPAQTLEVTAFGGAAVDFSLDADSGWIQFKETVVKPYNSNTGDETSITIWTKPHDLPAANYVDTIWVKSDGATSVPVLCSLKIITETAVRGYDGGDLPTSFALGQNYPNPFNPSTEIKFDLPVRAHVTLAIYNVLGQRVRTLVDKELPTGRYVADWDGRTSVGGRVASGVYFYRIEADSYIETRKMVLIK